MKLGMFSITTDVWCHLWRNVKNNCETSNFVGWRKEKLFPSGTQTLTTRPSRPVAIPTALSRLQIRSTSNKIRVIWRHSCAPRMCSSLPWSRQSFSSACNLYLGPMLSGYRTGFWLCWLRFRRFFSASSDEFVYGSPKFVAIICSLILFSAWRYQNFQFIHNR
jgi:hypothetical protein